MARGALPGRHITAALDANPKRLLAAAARVDAIVAIPSIPLALTAGAWACTIDAKMARSAIWNFPCFLLGLLLLARPLVAQAEASPSPADIQHGQALRIFVLTFGPGDEAWEKFGHNAVQVIDPNAPPGYQNLSYNWGTFSFDDKWAFYRRFIQGRLLYQMTSEPGGYTLYRYLGEHRAIWRQELNLTPAQKFAFQKVLQDSDTDAHRTYLYDYYKNNCTTKPRDVIDQLIGGRLKKQMQGPSGATYRWHTDRLDAQMPWLYVALRGVLGHPVDRPIDRWEQMFLPRQLRDGLASATVVIDGIEQPLVLKEQRVAGDRPPEPSAPPRWGLWFLLAGVALGLIYAGAGFRARRHWSLAIGFCLITFPWLLLMGIGGTIMVWGWVATDHESCRPNENVLHVSMLALPLLALMPLLSFGRRRGAKLAVRLTYLMAALSLCGALLKALPSFYQANWNIIALCLPVNLGLALAAYAMSRQPRTAAALTPESRNLPSPATP